MSNPTKTFEEEAGEMHAWASNQSCTESVGGAVSMARNAPPITIESAIRKEKV